jgi:hypothetical protein
LSATGRKEKIAEGKNETAKTMSKYVSIASHWWSSVSGFRFGSQSTMNPSASGFSSSSEAFFSLHFVPPFIHLFQFSENAPVSFCFNSLVTASTVLTSYLVKHKSTSFALSVPSISQAWRLLSSQFIFSTPGELVVGMILLYNFRHFERRFGSKKFASALLFYMTVGILLQLLILVSIPELKYVAPGPCVDILLHFFLHVLF